MITTEQLQKFCGEPTPKPFTRDGFTYALCRYYGVRVTGFQCPDHAVFATLEYIPFKCDAAEGWLPYPSIPEISNENCRDCDGTGKKNNKCYRCSGTGKAECDMGHWHDCDQCNGKGNMLPVISTCENCDGSGAIEKRTLVKLGNAHADARFLRLFADLPNVEFHPNGPETCINIRFTGGVGVLMPVYV